MPQISRKGAKMPASPIRKLVPYADEAKRQGKKIYHLNIGQPDIETPRQMIDAVRHADIKVLEYSHSAGFPSYREKLVNYYKRNNIEVTADDMLITTGGSEAISFGLYSCLDAGDEIIIPEPFYANYNGFAIAGDVKVKAIPSSVENNFALPPISEFEKMITPKTKAVMICNPNNPTGYLYAKEEIQALRDLVLKHDLFLFADEVYREFCYDDRTHHSVLEEEGIDEHAVLIDSVSKRYSACGARVGALVSRNKDVISTAMKFAQARLSPPTFAQIAAEASLDLPSDYFDEVKHEYVARRNLLVDALSQIDGVICPRPGGAFYTTVRLPVDDADKFCQWMLESFSLDNQTVMMAPASGFYATPDMGRDEVRIAYVLEKDELRQATECFARGLEEYPGRKE